ncbi:MAG: hypothetical protein MUF49_09595 [Oculatellaceae cyanobacterium Prado106]|jgi:hypothetical protein|nr:hypothetical protein [Oculatellaceae cyanobacterium Prado106]
MDFSQTAFSDSNYPIAYTAKIVAAKRAIEQCHLIPLFHNPYTVLLAGDKVENLLSRWQ